MPQKVKAGLSGVVVADSAIATVGISGKGLNYRGYPIEQLAESSSFEEVAFLLLNERLPSQQELVSLKASISESRALPEALVSILEALPKTSHPMDVTRTIVSAMGILEPEKDDFSN